MPTARASKIHGSTSTNTKFIARVGTKADIGIIDTVSLGPKKVT
jgi:hypothetical protein